jgi:hypothetical protein
MSRLLVPYLFQVGGKLSAGLYRTRTEWKENFLYPVMWMYHFPKISTGWAVALCVFILKP